MSLFMVKAILNGNVKTMFVECADEADAAWRCQHELNFGGRIFSVKFIRKV